VLLGGPVPDATQWEQSELVGDCAYPVCEPMAREAAQGEGMFPDDPGGRIGSWLKEHRALGAAAHARGLSRPEERPGRPTPA
jgi:hypothetical protein